MLVPLSTTTRRGIAATVALLVCACATPAFAQDGESGLSFPVTKGKKLGIVRMEEPDAETAALLRDHAKRRASAERELKLIRAKYIRGINNKEIRQVGISKIREYTDPAVFPALVELFRLEGPDVRDAVLDHFADQKSVEGDAALAWAAVFDRKAEVRQAARDRVVARAAEQGEVPDRVRLIVAEGLKRPRDREIGAAAELAAGLGLYEAIPALINAQVGGGTSASGFGSDGDNAPALAYILVAKQQAYVADLEPVVADSAVGFDPQLGVVTDGTYLRVLNAVVVTYRTEVHYALQRLASQGWGDQPVDGLGWDIDAWKEWYAKEFLPFREELARRERAEAAANPTSPEAPPSDPGVIDPPKRGG